VKLKGRNRAFGHHSAALSALLRSNLSNYFGQFTLFTRHWIRDLDAVQ